MDLKAVIVASVQGQDLSLHELLTNLKVKGRLRPLPLGGLLDLPLHLRRHRGWPTTSRSSASPNWTSFVL